MAATRENVLAAIVEYVENNKRRAPAKEIATIVGDKLPVVQGIIKELVASGAINSSRGRNGGATPNVGTQANVEVADTSPVADDDVAAQFAALVERLNQDEAAAAVG